MYVSGTNLCTVYGAIITSRVRNPLLPSGFGLSSGHKNRIWEGDKKKKTGDLNHQWGGCGAHFQGHGIEVQLVISCQEDRSRAGLVGLGNQSRT